MTRTSGYALCGAALLVGLGWAGTGPWRRSLPIRRSCASPTATASSRTSLYHRAGGRDPEAGRLPAHGRERADGDAHLHPRRRLDEREQGRLRAGIPAVPGDGLERGERRLPPGGRRARAGRGRRLPLRAAVGLPQRRGVRIRFGPHSRQRQLGRRAPVASPPASCPPRPASTASAPATAAGRGSTGNHINRRVARGGHSELVRHHRRRRSDRPARRGRRDRSPRPGSAAQPTARRWPNGCRR